MKRSMLAVLLLMGAVMATFTVAAMFGASRGGEPAEIRAAGAERG